MLNFVFCVGLRPTTIQIICLVITMDLWCVGRGRKFRRCNILYLWININKYVIYRSRSFYFIFGYQWSESQLGARCNESHRSLYESSFIWWCNRSRTQCYYIRRPHQNTIHKFTNNLKIFCYVNNVTTSRYIIKYLWQHYGKYISTYNNENATSNIL